MKVLNKNENNIKVTLCNCFNDDIEFDIDLKNVEFIRLQEISGDEVIRTYDKNMKFLNNYDSDTHNRIWDFNDFDECYPLYHFLYAISRTKVKFYDIDKFISKTFREVD